ncbi:DUF421 domain-containing protein [Dietzia alimentaria]|uniref:DUF421 domain-containing protein n=1 Tax=Dietzia alimentaria TaxID=665550 RepID=UPI00029A07CE|nr:YetF domain-containing protein [Dietzia alimentaria]
MWFSSLDPIVRVLLIGPVAYVAMVAAIRLSGKRVLSKLNAFDMVVTVALGSLLATILTSSDLALVTGLVGIILLLGLQVLVSLFTSRLVKGRTVVRARPVLLAHRGALLEEAIASSRLTHDEVFQAMRSSGFGGLDQVAAVCLESDGTLSVIGTSTAGDGKALVPLPGWTGS